MIATRFYAILAWLLAAIGLLHLATTWSLTNSSPFTRVWFFGSGIAMIQLAAMNLLNRHHGGTFGSLRWATCGFNVLMLSFAAVAGTISGATTVELLVVLGVLAGLLVCSLLPAARESR